MLGLVKVLLLANTLVAAVPAFNPNPKSAWNLQQFKNFITFGDSYTDESRLAYFYTHGGAAPPPGTLLPQVGCEIGAAPLLI